MNDNQSTDELTTTIIKIINERKPQNVQQLITIVKAEISLPEQKILDAVMKMQIQGTLQLDDSDLPPSPNSTLWYWTTIALAAITVTVVFTVPEDFYPWSYLRNALGIIFVLFLPGYTVIKALFPLQVPIKMSTENLDTVERIALSLGMSIAIVPIIGLILNYTPWGIRVTPIVLSLFALTLISATVAIMREKHQKMVKNQRVY